jgi:hypothetical protein
MKAASSIYCCNNEGSAKNKIREVERKNKQLEGHSQHERINSWKDIPSTKE